MKQYKCLWCGKNVGEPGDLPLTEMCKTCFDRYRVDEAFREEYHRKYPRNEAED